MHLLLYPKRYERYNQLNHCKCLGRQGKVVKSAPLLSDISSLLWHGLIRITLGETTGYSRAPCIFEAEADQNEQKDDHGADNKNHADRTVNKRPSHEGKLNPLTACF